MKHTSSYSLKRALAALLIICLGTGGLSPTPPAAASLETKLEQADAAQLNLDLTLPREIGTIETSQHSQSREAQVFIIQDAHAVGAAQKSIYEIVRFLAEKKGLRLFAVEGAAERLEPVFYKAFSEQERLRSVILKHVTLGEISGAAAAAVLIKEPALFAGVENDSLYVEGINLFLASLQAENQLGLKVNDLKKMGSTLSQKINSPELLKLERDAVEFESREKNKSEVALKYFESKYSSLVTREQYPALYSIFKELKSRQSAGSLAPQLNKFAAAVESKLKTTKERQIFESQRQAYNTEKLSPASYALFLVNQAQALRLEIPENIAREVRGSKYLEEIHGADFLREWETFVGAAKEKLFQTQEQKNLAQLRERLSRIEKMTRLELTRRDWETLKNKSYEVDQEKLGASLQEFAGGIHRLSRELEGSVFEQFYQNAEDREAAMVENLLKLMKKQKVKEAALTLGGFHTEGVAKKLQEKKISCVLITPAVSNTEDAEHYRDFMRGEVSWKRYFEVKNGQVNLHDAFARAVRDQLLAQRPQSTDDSQQPKEQSFNRGLLSVDRRLIKRWRDQILRELARENRLAEAARYTKLIDERIESPTVPGLSQAGAWHLRVAEFIKSLAQLKSEKRLTPENFHQMLGGKIPSAVLAWNAAAPFVPNQLRSQDWISGLPDSQEYQAAQVRSESREIKLFNEQEKKDFINALIEMRMKRTGSDDAPIKQLSPVGELRTALNQLLQGRAWKDILSEHGSKNVESIASAIGVVNIVDKRTRKFLVSVDALDFMYAAVVAKNPQAYWDKDPNLPVHLTKRYDFNDDLQVKQMLMDYIDWLTSRLTKRPRLKFEMLKQLVQGAMIPRGRNEDATPLHLVYPDNLGDPLRLIIHLEALIGQLINLQLNRGGGFHEPRFTSNLVMIVHGIYDYEAEVEDRVPESLKKIDKKSREEFPNFSLTEEEKKIVLRYEEWVQVNVRRVWRMDVFLGFLHRVIVTEGKIDGVTPWDSQEYLNRLIRKAGGGHAKWYRRYVLLKVAKGEMQYPMTDQSIENVHNDLMRDIPSLEEVIKDLSIFDEEEASFQETSGVSTEAEEAAVSPQLESTVDRLPEGASADYLKLKAEVSDLLKQILALEEVPSHHLTGLELFQNALKENQILILNKMVKSNHKAFNSEGWNVKTRTGNRADLSGRFKELYEKLLETSEKLELRLLADPQQENLSKDQLEKQKEELPLQSVLYSYLLIFDHAFYSSQLQDYSSNTFLTHLLAQKKYATLLAWISLNGFQSENPEDQKKYNEKRTKLIEMLQAASLAEPQKTSREIASDDSASVDEIFQETKTQLELMIWMARDEKQREALHQLLVIAREGNALRLLDEFFPENNTSLNSIDYLLEDPSREIRAGSNVREALFALRDLAVALKKRLDPEKAAEKDIASVIQFFKVGITSDVDVILKNLTENPLGGEHAALAATLINYCESLKEKIEEGASGNEIGMAYISVQKLLLNNDPFSIAFHQDRARFLAIKNVGEKVTLVFAAEARQRRFIEVRDLAERLTNLRKEYDPLRVRAMELSRELVSMAGGYITETNFLETALNEGEIWFAYEMVKSGIKMRDELGWAFKQQGMFQSTVPGHVIHKMRELLSVLEKLSALADKAPEIENISSKNFSKEKNRQLVYAAAFPFYLALRNPTASPDKGLGSEMFIQLAKSKKYKKLKTLLKNAVIAPREENGKRYFEDARRHLNQLIDQAESLDSELEGEQFLSKNPSLGELAEEIVITVRLLNWIVYCVNGDISGSFEYVQEAENHRFSKLEERVVHPSNEKDQTVIRKIAEIPAAQKTVNNLKVLLAEVNKKTNADHYSLEELTKLIEKLKPETIRVLKTEKPSHKYTEIEELPTAPSSSEWGIFDENELPRTLEGYRASRQNFLARFPKTGWGEDLRAQMDIYDRGIFLLETLHNFQKRKKRLEIPKLESLSLIALKKLAYYEIGTLQGKTKDANEIQRFKEMANLIGEERFEEALEKAKVLSSPTSDVETLPYSLTEILSAGAMKVQKINGLKERIQEQINQSISWVNKDEAENARKAFLLEYWDAVQNFLDEKINPSREGKLIKRDSSASVIKKEIMGSSNELEAFPEIRNNQGPYDLFVAVDNRERLKLLREAGDLLPANDSTKKEIAELSLSQLPSKLGSIVSRIADRVLRTVGEGMSRGDAKVMAASLNMFWENIDLLLDAYAMNKDAQLREKILSLADNLNAVSSNLAPEAQKRWFVMRLNIYTKLGEAALERIASERLVEMNQRNFDWVRAVLEHVFLSNLQPVLTEAEGRKYLELLGVSEGIVAENANKASAAAVISDMKIYKGILLVRLGNRDSIRQAIELFTDAEDVKLKQSSMLYLGYLEVKAGNEDNARQLFSEVARETPTDPEAKGYSPFNQIYSLLMLKDLNGAEARVRELLSREQGQSDRDLLYLYLFGVLKAQNRESEARGAFFDLIQRLLSNSELRVKIQREMMEPFPVEGCFMEEFLRYSKEVIKDPMSWPENPEAIGYILDVLHEYQRLNEEEAEKLFEQWLESSEEVKIPWNKLKIMLDGLSRWEEAPAAHLPAAYKYAITLKEKNPELAAEFDHYLKQTLASGVSELKNRLKQIARIENVRGGVISAKTEDELRQLASYPLLSQKFDPAALREFAEMRGRARAELIGQSYQTSLEDFRYFIHLLGAYTTIIPNTFGADKDGVNNFPKQAVELLKQTLKSKTFNTLIENESNQQRLVFMKLFLETAEKLQDQELISFAVKELTKTFNKLNEKDQAREIRLSPQWSLYFSRSMESLLDKPESAEMTRAAEYTALSLQAIVTRLRQGGFQVGQEGVLHNYLVEAMNTYSNLLLYYIFRDHPELSRQLEDILTNYFAGKVDPESGKHLFHRGTFIAAAANVSYSSPEHFLKAMESFLKYPEVALPHPDQMIYVPELMLRYLQEKKERGERSEAAEAKFREYQNYYESLLSTGTDAGVLSDREAVLQRAFFAVYEERYEDALNELQVNEKDFPYETALQRALILSLAGKEKEALESLAKTIPENGTSKKERILFSNDSATLIETYQYLSENQRGQLVKLYFDWIKAAPSAGPVQVNEILKIVTFISPQAVKAQLRDYFENSFLQGGAAWNNERDIPLLERLAASGNDRLTVFRVAEKITNSPTRTDSKIKKIRAESETSLTPEDFLNWATDLLKAGAYEEAKKIADRGLKKNGVTTEMTAALLQIQEKIQQIAALKSELVTAFSRGNVEKALNTANELETLNPGDKNAKKAREVMKAFEDAVNKLGTGNFPDAVQAVAAIPDYASNDFLKAFHQNLQIAEIEVKKLNDLIQGKYFRAAQQALSALPNELGGLFDRKIDFQAEVFTQTQERITEMELQVEQATRVLTPKEGGEKMNDSRLRANIKFITEAAKALAEFPSEANGVYYLLINKAAALFNAGAYKTAFNTARLVFEIETVRADEGPQTAAERIMNQAAAQIWLPVIINDLKFVSLKLAAEEAREEREAAVKPSGLEFSFGMKDFKIEDGKLILNNPRFVGRKGDKILAGADQLVQGDVFRITPAPAQTVNPSANAKNFEGKPSLYQAPAVPKPLAGYFKLLKFTPANNGNPSILELELPKTQDNQETQKKMLEQSLAQGGTFKRGSSPVDKIQRDMLIRIYEAMIKNQKTRIDANQLAMEPVSTGNRLMDLLMGLETIRAQEDAKVAAQKATANAMIQKIESDIQKRSPNFKFDDSQKEALFAVLNPSIPVVFIQGPPGTGKTNTTAAALTILRGDRMKMKTVVTSQQHHAVDNILERLLDLMAVSGALPERNKWTPEILENQRIVRLGSNPPPEPVPVLEDLRLKRRSVLSAIAANWSLGFVTGGSSNGMFIDSELRRYPDLLRSGVFLDMDEASRATSSEALMPLEILGKGVDKIVLTGDHFQLGPTGIVDTDIEKIVKELSGWYANPQNYESDGKEKKITREELKRLAGKIPRLKLEGIGSFSLQDILFSRELLGDFKTSLFERGLDQYLEVDPAGEIFKVTRPPFFVLKKNRRSGKRITESFRGFYRSRGLPLEAARGDKGFFLVDDIAGLSFDNRRKNGNGNEAGEVIDESQLPLINEGEVDRVIYWLNDLINRRGLDPSKPNDLAVITPYQGQVGEIEDAVTAFAKIHDWLTALKQGKAANFPSAALDSKYVQRRLWSFIRQTTARSNRQDQDWKDSQNLAELNREIKSANVKLLPEKIEALFLAFGLGEKFVRVEDIDKTFKVSTVDSAIGNEWRAVIGSWVRSNPEANIGFLNDFTRPNVLLSRAADYSIQIGDFSETFSKTRNDEISGMAKSWLALSNETFYEMLAEGHPWAIEKSGDVRSEVREVVSAVVDSLNGTGAILPKQAEIFLEAYNQQPEAVITFTKLWSENPKYLQAASAAWDSQSFYNEHSDFEKALEEKTNELIKETKARAQEYLKNRPQAKITYAFGISLESAVSPEDKAPQEVLKYLQMLSALKRENPNAKIETEITILLSGEQIKEKQWLPFIKEIQRNPQTAKIYDASSKSARGEIENFLRRRGNALLYGFPGDFIQDEELKSRAVASEIALDSSLPVTFTLTEHLAYDEIRLRPELLGNVIETAHLRGPVRFDGFALTITESAAALVYEALAAHAAVSAAA